VPSYVRFRPRIRPAHAQSGLTPARPRDYLCNYITGCAFRREQIDASRFRRGHRALRSPGSDSPRSRRRAPRRGCYRKYHRRPQDDRTRFARDSLKRSETLAEKRGGREWNRTIMSRSPVDFESTASASSATRPRSKRIPYRLISGNAVQSLYVLEVGRTALPPRTAGRFGACRDAG
jgi:hypothetical protein